MQWIITEKLWAFFGWCDRMSGCAPYCVSVLANLTIIVLWGWWWLMTLLNNNL
jgi:hypothetical protein